MTGLSTRLLEVKARGEQAILAEVVAAKHGLNERQAVLIGAFMVVRKHLSLADCEGLLPDVARRTIQPDLKMLVEQGVVGEAGQGLVTAA